MNEKNNAKRLRSLINAASKRFTGMGRGSKILLKVGSCVFFAFLLIALALEVFFVTGTIILPDHIQLIQWTVLYSFRFWVMIVFGALILDILVKR